MNNRIEAAILIASAFAVLFTAMVQQVLAIIIAIVALFIVGVYNFFKESQL